MKKLLALTLLLSAAGLGVAGSKTNRTVYISGNWVSGSLGGARNSGDTTQYIGCYVYGNEASNFKSMYCSARDVSGTHLNCYSDAPAVVDIAGRLNSDSFLQFTVNTAGDCMSIRVDNYSYDVPKQ
ncbi:MAG TPA: hypothetical protein VIV11_40485 [Kofleriaceae bacterium]